MDENHLNAKIGQQFSALIYWLPTNLGQEVILSVNATIGRYPRFFAVPSTIAADVSATGQYDIALSEVSSNTSQWIEGANKLTISILDGSTGEVIDIQTLIVHVYAN